MNNNAIITHLINKVPEEYEIIVVLGYKGQLLKDYCKAAHPDRNFSFINVDKYEGEDTGPGYSINFAKNQLQRPFIWATVDTLVLDDLPKADHDWIGVYPTSMPELYSTAEVKNGAVTKFTNKSKDGFDYAFIGLAGVYDYKTFWKELNGPEIVSAYYNVKKYKKLECHNFEWFDIGTVDNYFRSKKAFEDNINYSIPKTNGEFLYKVGERFLKLSPSKSFIQGRINRAKTLKDLVPSLVYNSDNLYAYNWISGNTLYECDNIKVWKKFLEFLTEKLWKPYNYETTKMSILCKKFYKEKTISRLNNFLKSRSKWYKGEHLVNGHETGMIETILNNFDWESICDGTPTKLFHGDLQFDNALYSDEKSFHLLDWRQDFAGEDIGDVYYDLSKMYGGILMSYKLMKEESNFSITTDDSLDDNSVTFNHKTTDNLDKFIPHFESWVDDNGFELEKIKKITSLIFLNMSPLHEKKFGDLLFFKSKILLSELS